MNRRMLVVFLGALFAGNPFPALAQSATRPSSAFDESMIAREKSLIEARRKGDSAAVKRMLTGNFAMVGIDGSLIERAEAADELDLSDFVEYQSYDFKVSSSSDVAVVTYEAVMQKAPEEDQGPPPRYQHFSSVWVRQGEDWKLQFAQTTAKHWGDW